MIVQINSLNTEIHDSNITLNQRNLKKIPYDVRSVTGVLQMNLSSNPNVGLKSFTNLFDHR